MKRAISRLKIYSTPQDVRELQRLERVAHERLIDPRGESATLQLHLANARKRKKSSRGTVTGASIVMRRKLTNYLACDRSFNGEPK